MEFFMHSPPQSFLKNTNLNSKEKDSQADYCLYGFSYISGAQISEALVQTILQAIWNWWGILNLLQLAGGYSY